MKSAELRSAFRQFFKEQGHTEVGSSSLVPHNDATLLFTNAGMNQFKDRFLGRGSGAYSRAVTVQRCVRAGGKHNDLENVGYTSRHHTFFEMLGNFSFGDYFKREAIGFAWTFLTEKLGLPPEKLWVTVYEKDKEAEKIWLEDMGVAPERFSRLGEQDNFWSMGKTGPCGPCSEIFYDHGATVAGDPPGGQNDEGDRYVEIWNMVFMQYNRTSGGELQPLPKPSIDTGMGLERIAAVMQGVCSNYEIDTFSYILKKAGTILEQPDTCHTSLRVIADHIRSAAFLVADGVRPSNEGRGYVLRRIIRRACRHGHKLGATEPFFYRLVPALVEAMTESAACVAEQQQQVTAVLRGEEEQFARTLDKGMRIFEESVAELAGQTIPGSVAFTLYDTYGFPLDLTCDIARERGLDVDRDGYHSCMEEQRRRARGAGKFQGDYGAELQLQGATTFNGYRELCGCGTVQNLVVAGQRVDGVDVGQPAVVVLDETPFYGEAGGQAGDTGFLESENGTFQVEETTRQGEVFLHRGVQRSGTLRTGETVQAAVDRGKREDTARNHSATHLLHEALRRILGSHVEQRGSWVDHQRLRFDFAHREPLSPAQLQSVQSLVNSQIRANTAVQTEQTDMETAKALGARMLFAEKYADVVRVLKMGEDNFSVELCGGTHVQHTGDIGPFVIVGESGVAAGIRRIEALTGALAQEWLDETGLCLQHIGEQVKGDRKTAVDKVKGLVERCRDQQKELGRLRFELACVAADAAASTAIDVQGVKLVTTTLDGVEAGSLRSLTDRFKQKLGTGVVVLATVNGSDKINLVCGVTKDLAERIAAKDLLATVVNQVGGRSGGRADFAQGGGVDVGALASALSSVQPWLRERLASSQV